MRYFLSRRLARQVKPSTAVLEIWRHDPKEGFVMAKEWRLTSDREALDIAVIIDEGDFVRLRWDGP